MRSGLLRFRCTVLVFTVIAASLSSSVIAGQRNKNAGSTSPDMPKIRMVIFSGYGDAKEEGFLLGADLSYRFSGWLGTGCTVFGLNHDEDVSFSTVQTGYVKYALLAYAGYLQLHTRRLRVRAGWGAFNEKYEDMIDKWDAPPSETDIAGTSTGPVFGAGYWLGSDSVGVSFNALGFYPLDGKVTDKLAIMGMVGVGFGI